MGNLPETSKISKPGAQETTLSNVTGTVSRNNPRSLCES